jgi:tRNA (guanine26-N2/guanine27-N2)-dimethyltransferase
MSADKSQLITEGKASFQAFMLPGPEGADGTDDREKWETKKVPTKSMPVFFNPHMEFNRDISVVAVKTWQDRVPENMSIADVMCGAGIRGIRYLVEAGGTGTHVTFLDLNPAAIRACKANADLNGIPEESITLDIGDANEFLFNHGRGETTRFHVIDIDPFGNPMEFVAGALRALKRENGMLQVNATDLAVLSGHHFRAAKRKYLATPLRQVPYHAEMGARIVLGGIFRKALEQDASIRPLLTFAKRHFVKVIVEKVAGAERGNEDLHQLGYVVQCRSCFDHAIITADELAGSTACAHCGSPRIDNGGPMWIGPLHDEKFCIDALEALKAIPYLAKKNSEGKMLELCAAEATLPPIGYDIHDLASKAEIRIPSFDRIIEAVRAAGWNVARDSINPLGIKTTASRNALIDIVRSMT